MYCTPWAKSNIYDCLVCFSEWTSRFNRDSIGTSLLASINTVVHHSLTSTYMPTFIEIEETFVDGRTYIRRLRRVKLKNYLNKISGGWVSGGGKAPSPVKENILWRIPVISLNQMFPRPRCTKNYFPCRTLLATLILHVSHTLYTQIMEVRKGKERKHIYIVPFIYYVYLKALRHGSHSFTCKYTMPAFPSYAFTR